MGTFYGNQIMRTREAAHRVLIEPSLGDPCTALCVIDRVPKPRAALAAASLSALGLSRRKITHTSTSIWVMPVRSSAPKKLEPPHPLFPSCVTRPRPKAGRAANDEAYRCGPVHSACAPIPAALMIGHHFSISAFWNVASPSGVCSGSRGATSSPRSANRLRTAGSASASTIAPLSLAMMSFGVPLGAKNPNHPDIESCRLATSIRSRNGVAIRIFVCTPNVYFIVIACHPFFVFGQHEVASFEPLKFVDFGGQTRRFQQFCVFGRFRTILLCC